MAMRFCALLPQLEHYDEDHFQVPPGFHVIFLPFADDITKPALDYRPEPFSQELLSLTKLLVNNLTLQDYNPKNFESPSLQKFYAHLQAHALNEPEI
jgi:ATP-dependent DNA helicase 2 subunit 1